MEQRGQFGRIIWITVAVAIVYVTWFNFYKFVITKNYDFYVEAPCNPESETCYLRDCEDYCPPNGMAEYKIWMLSAADFADCSDETCAAECESGTVKCEEVPCNPEIGDCS